VNLEPLLATAPTAAVEEHFAAGRIARFAILEEPPTIESGEITDKGYVNQRAVLARRAARDVSGAGLRS